MFYWFWQWNIKFENRSIFYEVKASKTKWAGFWATLYFQLIYTLIHIIISVWGMALYWQTTDLERQNAVFDDEEAGLVSVT